MSFCLIILAGGNSNRFKSNIGKPYQKIAGKSLIEISVDKARQFDQIKKIIIVYNKKDSKRIKSLKLKNVQLIIGGQSRQQSTYNSLKYLIKKKNISKVLIHDAARPNFSIKLLKNISKNLKKHKAVVPFIYSKDSIKYKIKNQIFNLNRKNSLLTQTPQAFRFKDLYNLAHKEKNKINDEATLFLDLNYKIKLH